MQDNHDWLREKVQKESVGFGSEYWQEVGAVLAQFDGMLEGHRKSCPSSKPLEVVDLLLLNMLGDLYDVMPGLERCGGVSTCSPTMHPTITSC